MNLSKSMKNMWSARDELSLRYFRVELLPVFLLLPLAIIIGDLRFLDQELVVFGIDSNNLIMMVYGLGFLPVFFAKEKRMTLLLRFSVFLQAALLMPQFFMGAGTSKLIVYLVFHAANAVSTACGFYLFAFRLNNVERLVTMAGVQLYYAFTYLFLKSEPIAGFFRTYGSAAVMLAFLVVVFFIKNPLQSEEKPKTEPNARQSGVTVIIALNMLYYIITLMAMYIEYQETTVSALLYGIGGIVSLLVIVVVMLIFNYSALHLWSLCLVCSVLGIGALHYATSFTVNGGSLLYGLGEGLGFMIIFYLMGGALKRSGSFRQFRLWCLFLCVNYFVISGGFYFLYNKVNAPGIAVAFPAVLVLMVICFLFAPILHDKLFRTDWTDGYHMTDMPLYKEAIAQAEKVDEELSLNLTPREKEIFALLLTDAPYKVIASELGISGDTVKFHTKNLYRKLNIQSRTELFTQYGNQKTAS